MNKTLFSFFTLALSFAFFTQFAAAQTADPIPSFYEEPGLSPNRDYVNQHFSEHIDPFTGKLQLHSVDLFLPGNGGLDIKVQRSYNSLNGFPTEPTVVGMGWSMHYGRLLRKADIDICASNMQTGKAPVLELPDGSRQILYLSHNWSYVQSTNRWKGVCATGGGGLFVYSPDGTRYEMTIQGTAQGWAGQQNSYYTARIVDRNNNTLNFSYGFQEGGGFGLTKITASDGRSVTFQYAGNTLSSITDSLGRIWSYTYDTSAGVNLPLLTKVTRPDGNSWEYAYYPYDFASGVEFPGNFSISQMTYPTGGTISYSYGYAQFNDNLPKTTVVTKKAGAGGTWIFSYNPATKQAVLSPDGTSYLFTEDEMMDRTVVLGPDGTDTYMHVGANSVHSGIVYAMGVLLCKSIDHGYQWDCHSWGNQKISDMENTRPGIYPIFDAGTYAALPTQDVIVRNGQSFVTTHDNYDAYGNAQTVTEAGTTTNNIVDTRTTTISYQVFPDLYILHLPKTVAVNTSGTIDTIDHIFDINNGNTLSENKYGVVTQFTYTGEGDIATKQDARGNKITYSDYHRGIPQQEAHPENVNITRLVDDAGNITSQTDGVGATTKYTYDGLNRLTKIVFPAGNNTIHPSGNAVTVTWSANQRQVERGAYQETTTFDGFGRTTSVVVEGGSTGPIKQTHQYDPVNRKIFSSYFNQDVGTFFKYDPLGRVYAAYHVATPSGSSYTGGSRTTQYKGRSILNTNERGLVTELDYRGYGNPDALDLLQVLTPDPTFNFVLTLNSLGQPLTIQQASLTRTNVYDSRHFLSSTTNPETGTTIYGRDAVGNMTSKQVGASAVTTYTYDGRNRLAAINYPTGTPSVTKTYNKDDSINTIDNGLTQRQYFYTPNKKLDHEILTVDGQSFTANYAYDGNDALSSTTYSTGLTMTYAPDGLGRPTQALPFASSVSFQANGQLQQIRYANGVVSDFAINARQWPSNLAMHKANGASLLDLSYTYDPNGNVTNITESVTGLQNRNFGYDNVDRLTSVDIPSAGVSGGQMKYDTVGNLYFQQFGPSYALGYTYDLATNKLKSVSGSRSMSFTYDAYGNVTGNGKNQFQYDDAFTMRCVDCGTPNEIDHVYDGVGTRVSVKKSSLTTYFMYGSNGNLLFDVDSNGIRREYGYVAGRNIAKTEH